MVNPSLFSSTTTEWETPMELFERLNEEHNFTLDVAASKENAKCRKFFTPESNGLCQDWSGHVCWMNPPYGRQVSKWVQKAFDSRTTAKVVALLPVRTDTEYFHEYIEKKEGVRYYFLKGRLKFGRLDIEVPNRAPFPSMVVVFDARPESKAKPPVRDGLANEVRSGS